MSHSLISPSMLGRIMGETPCYASVLMQKDLPDSSPGEAALIGTAKHEAAEQVLNTGWGSDDDDVVNYVAYVRGIAKESEKVWVEYSVSLDDYVPGMRGTADAIVLKGDDLHVIDLKTGSVRVDAAENPQLMAYALGAVDAVHHPVKRVHLHIAQPPLNHYDCWTIDRDGLVAFGIVLREAGRKAMLPDAPFGPSASNCNYCRYAPQCPALLQMTHELVTPDFDVVPAPESLTDEQLSKLVLNQRLLIQFINKVNAYATERVEQGHQLPGLKLVEGRTQRRWKPGAEAALAIAMGDAAYEKKLVGLTAAAKVIGKKTVDDLTFKPKGKPTLAPLDDNREAIDAAPLDDNREAIDAASDFDAITEKKGN